MGRTRKDLPKYKLELYDKPTLERIVLANRDLLAIEFAELFPYLEVARVVSNIILPKRQEALPLVKTDQSNLPIISRYESRSLQYLAPHEVQKIRSVTEGFKELFRTMGIQPLVEEEKNIKFLSRLAIYCVNSRKYNDAIFIFDLILREYPYDLRSLNNEAVILDGMGNYGVALHLLNEALRIFPDFTDTIINRAVK